MMMTTATKTTSKNELVLEIATTLVGFFQFTFFFIMFHIIECDSRHELYVCFDNYNDIYYILHYMFFTFF